MKKHFFCLIYTLIIGVVVFAQQPVVAKAPPMIMMNPLTPNEASVVGAVYDKLLSEARSIRILNQLVLEKGIRDYAFQPRDWTNTEKTIALGDVLNVGWVIRPQIQKRASEYNNGDIIVSAVLLNIQTREKTCTTPVMLENANEAQNKMPPLISEIEQIVNGASGGLSMSNQFRYMVGDRGPAGGWVAYDKKDYSDGWRYLEVAPQETEITLPKTSRYGEKIAGTGTAIGSGKINTELTLQSKNDYQIVKAARYCTDLELNWFKVWFLPSRQEMYVVTMWSNNFAGYNVGRYWSSSGSEEDTPFSARGKMPALNEQNLLLRAVRTF